MPSDALQIDPAMLPRSLSGALMRGIKGKCPRCGGTHLFRKLLKPDGYLARLQARGYEVEAPASPAPESSATAPD
mgnify:CR=1 FL=1